MRIRRVLFSVPVAIPAILSGCSSGPDFVAKYEPWRAEEENACLASGVLMQTSSLKTRSALGGPSFCGTVHPFEMAAADGGRVALKPPALLRCPMIPQIERWIRGVVQPAARRHFGSDVVELTVAASYSCRPMNHVSGARLSEHGYANAIDISAFKLSNGRKISVRTGWRGDGLEQAFLSEVHEGSCREFTTVLGPDYDSNHHDHFHLDLARHGLSGLKGICR